jgi:hypothetical protein
MLSRPPRHPQSQAEALAVSDRIAVMNAGRNRVPIHKIPPRASFDPP